MDVEVVADLFHASFGVMRQVDEDFTSLYGQWNHSYSSIFGDEGGKRSFSMTAI